MVYGEAMQWIDNSSYGIYSKRHSINPVTPSQNATHMLSPTINARPFTSIIFMGLTSIACISGCVHITILML